VGNIGNESLRGTRNNTKFKEKANRLKLVGAPLCARVVTVTRGGVVFCIPGSMPKYNFRGEGSDKGFSFQSQTRRGKLSRNTPEI
jgi:hypothetical protein